jgi:predicted nucleic acid-binding protein
LIVDTSAWIDFIRGSRLAVVDAVERALREGTAMTTDVVRLELLAGAAGAMGPVVRNVLDRCVDLPQVAVDDVETAADLFRACRTGGETVRSPNDCLIAAIAIRVEVAVLHNDRDFDAIARHSSLVAVRS